MRPAVVLPPRRARRVVVTPQPWCCWLAWPAPAAGPGSGKKQCGRWPREAARSRVVRHGHRAGAPGVPAPGDRRGLARSRLRVPGLGRHPGRGGGGPGRARHGAARTRAGGAGRGPGLGRRAPGRRFRVARVGRRRAPFRARSRAGPQHRAGPLRHLRDRAGRAHGGGHPDLRDQPEHAGLASAAVRMELELRLVRRAGDRRDPAAAGRHPPASRPGRRGLDHGLLRHGRPGRAGRSRAVRPAAGRARPARPVRASGQRPGADRPRSGHPRAAAQAPRRHGGHQLRQPHPGPAHHRGHGHHAGRRAAAGAAHLDGYRRAGPGRAPRPGGRQLRRPAGHGVRPAARRGAGGRGWRRCGAMPPPLPGRSPPRRPATRVTATPSACSRCSVRRGSPTTAR
jgi:hypothetical protein